MNKVDQIFSAVKDGDAALPKLLWDVVLLLFGRYMKYLYPYECEKLKLSTLSELQSAIDGNRREGRRPGYGYEFSPLPASMLSTPPCNPHLNPAPPTLHPSLVTPASRLATKGLSLSHTFVENSVLI